MPSPKNEAVKVVVRVRPALEKETRGNEIQFQIDSECKQLSVSCPSREGVLRIFNYDRVFGKNVTQSEIYQQTTFELVDSVVEGYNATVFAYGMTGSGKTYTMIGKEGEERGIIPRSFSQLMSGIQSNEDRNFMAHCSFIEIYNEQLRDLLDKTRRAKLDIHQSATQGVQVKGGRKVLVRSVEEMRDVLETGMRDRVVATTAMNSESSRSHIIFTVHLESSEDDKNFRISKLHLVDLAGSERVGRMNAVGVRFYQGAKINLSLGALGNVINALIDKKSKHVPYRDSKLTRLLQDSLGGNARTMMISTVSPSANYFEETVCTLRFSSRAQLISNSPVLNGDHKDALLREYEQEIRRLKRLLKERHDSELQEEVTRLEGDILRPGTVITGAFSKEQYKSLKQKVEEQRRQRIRVEQQKKLKEEQLIFMENNYQTLEEEVGEMRDLLKQLRLKYKVAAQELVDLENDHQSEQQFMLDSIRSLTREVQIYQNVISKLVSPEQMEQILALADSKQADWPEGIERTRSPRRQETVSMMNSGGFKVRKFRSIDRMKVSKTGSNFRTRK